MYPRFFLKILHFSSSRLTLAPERIVSVPSLVFCHGIHGSPLPKPTPAIRERVATDAMEEKHATAEERRTGAEEEGTQLMSTDPLPASSPGDPTADPLKTSAGSPCRRSFRLDPRLEEEVTHSQKDASGRFINPWPTWNFPSLPALARGFLMEKNHSNIPTSKEVLDKELPVVEPFFVQEPHSLGSLGPGPEGGDGGMRVTWLGHASVLVEMEGLVLLTDPVFSERASPLPRISGPRRYRGPPCTVEQLPRLDAVLISHTHYDHLDVASVRALEARFGPELRWLVPLGLLEWMQGCGCRNVLQLDWWEENCVPGHDHVTFVLTPAQHWCKRTPFDDNRTLWGSWTVLGPSKRFFFAGDTGYCSAFQEIGKRYGPFDLAAIPIGAYEPRSIMRSQHVDPEEAVKIHIDVQAKRSIGIHWGTFPLTYEYYLEPPMKVREAMKQHGCNPEDFFTVNHGESRILQATKD